MTALISKVEKSYLNILLPTKLPTYDTVVGEKRLE